jgi:hypothetical protein
MAIAVAALTFAGCGAAKKSGATATSRASTSFTVKGTLDLSDTDSASNLDPDGYCLGIGGYLDINAGAQVTVTNQSQTIIGTSQLGQGVPQGSSGVETDCLFPFTVTGLPKASFYTFTVGHRGGVTYSASEMAAKGWTVSLTLGQ